MAASLVSQLPSLADVKLINLKQARVWVVEHEKLYKVKKLSSKTQKQKLVRPVHAPVNAVDSAFFERTAPNEYSCQASNI